MNTNTNTDGKLSFSDIVASLTGYEEVAIEDRFGAPIGNLMRGSLTKAGRALVFVIELRRDTNKANKAYKTAMDLTVTELNDMFLDENEDQDDFDPDEPDTPQGKDDSPSD